MTTYARLTQNKLALEQLVELTPEQYAVLGAWKQSFLRLYVVDAAPTPSASQKVVEAAPVIDATSYRKTWALVAKTQAELNADANVTDAPNVTGVAVITAIQNRINLDRSGLTATQKIGALEADVVMLLKICRYFVRQQP